MPIILIQDTTINELSDNYLCKIVDNNTIITIYFTYNAIRDHSVDSKGLLEKVKNWEANEELSFTSEFLNISFGEQAIKNNVNDTIFRHYYAYVSTNQCIHDKVNILSSFRDHYSTIGNFTNGNEIHFHPIIINSFIHV